jgi:hypothetical protein
MSLYDWQPGRLLASISCDCPGYVGNSISLTPGRILPAKGVDGVPASVQNALAMKRLTLLGSVVIALSGVSAIAQGNTISMNAAAYCAVTVPANSLALIANPFYAPTNTLAGLIPQPHRRRRQESPVRSPTNTLAGLIPQPPPGSQFFKFRPNADFVAYTFGVDGKWTPNGDATLYPGEGGLFRNPTVSPLRLMFQGSLPIRDLTNTVPAGVAIYAASRAGKVTSDLCFPAGPGDQIMTYGGGGYTTYTLDASGLKWTPSEPTLRLGEAFFCRKSAPGIWVSRAVVVR